MTVADLRDRLRGEGDEVARGHVRIDAARALAKLRDHRLADPHDYVLDLVRAAVASKAEKIQLRIDADDVELDFDGEPFPQEVLRELFAHAVGAAGAGEARHRLLALGVTAALGLEPSHVTVLGSGVALRVSPPAELEVEGGEAARAGTRVHVRDRVSWRVLKRLVGGAPEERTLRARARGVGVELWLNGERLDAPPLAGAAWRLDRVEHGMRLVAALNELPTGAAQLTVATHGVEVVTRALGGLSPHLAVWARHDGLRLNASASDVVVDDDAYLQLLERVRHAADDLLGEALRDLEEKRDAVTAIAIAAWRASPSRRVQKLIERAPLLPGPSGEWISRRDLARELAAGRPIRYAPEPLDSDDYSGVVVLLDERSAARALIPEGHREDVMPAVRQRRRREENRARFATQRVEQATLPDGDDVARATIDAKGISGELALPRQARAAQVRFLREARLLEQRHDVPELRPLRLRAVVRCDSLSPDEAWSAVAPDAERARVLGAIRKAARKALLARLAAGVLDDPEDAAALRGHARDLLRDLTASSAPIPDALKAAAIYPAAGGGWVSLATLADEPEVREAPGGWPHPALDGRPVLCADPVDRPAIQKLVRGSFRDVTAELAREEQVRERLGGPREAPVLRDDCVAAVPIHDGEVIGETGVPRDGAPRLHVRLLRDGVFVEDVTVEPVYGGALAVVEHPGLTPRPGWDGVERDRAYQRALAAVRDAQPGLVAALLDRVGATLLDVMPRAARATLEGFLRAELRTAEARRRATGAARRVLEAPIFRTLGGARSLAQLAEPGGALWTLDEPPAAPGPTELLVVIADAALRELLREVLSVPTKDASEAIAEARARAAHEAQPPRAAVVATDAPKLALETSAVRGEIAHHPSGHGCRIGLLVLGRWYRETLLERALPTTAMFELRDDVSFAERTLPQRIVRKLERAVERGEARLVEQALEAPDDPGARRLLLDALAALAELDLPAPTRARLEAAPLYPTTAGERLSADELERRTRIAFVTVPLSGAPDNGEPVVLAVDPQLARALDGWKLRLVDVTESLSLELAARRARERLPQVERIEVAGPVAWRRRLEDPDGEVALAPGEPRVTYYRDRRRIAEERWPGGPPNVAAAADAARLRLTADGLGVEHDAAHGALLAQLVAAAEEMVGTIAGVLDAVEPSDRPAILAALPPLAAWLAFRGKGDHPAARLPLFATSDGRQLSFAELDAIHAREGSMLASDATGRLVDGEPVWRPRPGERAQVAERVGWTLVDATAALQAAARLPTVASLDAGPAGAAREAIVAPGIEGTVALAPRAPTRRRVLELCRGRTLVATVEDEHPVGFIARVAHDALRVAPRSGAPLIPQAVLDAVDAAAERAVAAILRAGGEPAEAYALAAARWTRGRAGPVADALTAAPLFRDARGAPVTLGRVRAEAARHGGVALCDPGVPLPDGEAPLVGDPHTRALLGELAVPMVDHTPRLRELAQTRARLEARRRREPPEVVLRWPVDVDDWTGVLYLVPGSESDATIIVGVTGGPPRFEVRVAGVGGWLDHAKPHESVVPRLVEALFARLAGDDVPPLRRAAAAAMVLRWLRVRGVNGARELDGLEGLGARLATAKLFRTVDGRWVDLRALAAHVAAGGVVPVVPARRLVDDEPGAGVTLRLEHDTPHAELEAVLGKGSVMVYRDLDAWRAARREADPERGTTSAEALARLRGEMESLRGDAFRRLGGGELRELILRRDGGEVAVSYDAPRAVAALDPEHPGVKRVLDEGAANPARRYALLAAVFGAVNRALHQVTDEDEAMACGALLEYLAANPQLVDGT